MVFNEDVFDFFTELKMNNTKEWFEENRERYDNSVVNPSREFVIELGEKLQSISEGFEAIPKVNKSLFRINRDVRFSKNKSPYKTNLGMMFWEGARKRMENSGVYVHLEAENCFIATGLHEFSKDVLESYRQTILSKPKAKELEGILSRLEKTHKISGEKYKNVPRGFDKEYEFAELLKYKGIFVMKSFDDDLAYSDELYNRVIKQMNDTMELHNWFVKNV